MTTNDDRLPVPENIYDDRNLPSWHKQSKRELLANLVPLLKQEIILLESWTRNMKDKKEELLSREDFNLEDYLDVVLRECNRLMVVVDFMAKLRRFADETEKD